jgi:hypothetical protein
MPNLLALLLLADLVSVVPEMTTVPLPGESREVEIMFRNVSELPLLDVRLHARSEGCGFRVAPESIPRVRPSDRASFRVTLLRTGATGNRRFPIDLQLASRHHEKLRGFQIIADGREQAEAGGGWIDVGVVKIGSSQARTRTLLFALLGVVPLGGLLVLGWYLKKRAREKDSA